MTIKVIIAGGALCAITAAGGLGLAALSDASATEPRRSPIVASSPVQPMPETAVTRQVIIAPEEEALLPEDVTITFVAARAPQSVAESLAPEVSRHPLMRSGEIRPAVQRQGPSSEPVTRNSTTLAEPVRATIRNNPAADVQSDPEWTTGVYR